MIFVMFILFGFLGLKTGIIIILVFVYPANLVLRWFDLEEIERVILSFLFGLSVFPLFVYYLFKLIPSLKWSFAIILVIAYILGIAKRVIDESNNNTDGNE